MKSKSTKRLKQHSSDSSKTTIIDLVPSILKLKLILVPIDFSDTSRKALEYAVPFAEQFVAEILLIHVIEPPYAYGSDETLAPIMINYERLTKTSAKKLDQLAQKTGSRTLFKASLVRTGRPYQEIVDTARSSKADLIIITTHGYTGFKHVFLGSTAERVVRHAPCPVLTVRQREHEFV